MSYKKILSRSIKESGWSMREIARRCTNKGVNLSQGYLSKLINEDIPPASDKINLVLGEVLSPVTSIEFDELYIEAYKDRIPKRVLDKLLSGV
ncbi:hypothetical protein [Paenibacillus odorifer]|uniref:hypothetical protein n=1 Tax=Paenibacillus odorifer TaxID=189426 RepID=UPI00096D455A|nr:hypothetical protein [Paenibacillus odorifer]OME23386.1 hypothetical protein BSK57_16365 [Paenibacillus odorifer]